MSLLEDLLPSLHPELGHDQRQALRLLASDGNVFVTGGAGTGKSYLMRKFLADLPAENYPILASTGAAAVLVGGRTFHSFFGLGILEGGHDATVKRALENRRVVRRLRRARGVVIDEISMIPGLALDTAERISRIARASDDPWGGLRIIAVGDFAQLPPVGRGPRRDWAFLSTAWQASAFRNAVLRETLRSREADFAEVLNDLREGSLTERTKSLLDARCLLETDPDFEGSLLFARREDVERLNRHRLASLPGRSRSYPTEWQGDERFLKSLRASLPVSDEIELKPEALVMIRQNDPLGRWVNGSLGRVLDLGSDEIELRLLSGRTVTLGRASFRLLDGEGNELASARNFPLVLAYALTIHKAQGATLDRVVANLQDLWEPGQAYVALSRVRRAQDLWIDGWNTRSILADPEVRNFHALIAGC